MESKKRITAAALARHRRLHRHLDRLMAIYMSEPESKALIETSLVEFYLWSQKKCGYKKGEIHG